MPKIPSYEGLQVQQTTAPVPKISTEIPSIEAFGGGKSLQALDSLEKVILQAKKEADETFVKDAENKVRVLRNKYLFDEKDGFLNKTAKSLDKNDPDNIFMQSEKYTSDFEKGIEDIQRNLSSDQRSALQNSIFDVRNNFNESIAKHVTTEREAFTKSSLLSSIDLHREDALNNSHDPVAVKQSVELQLKDLENLAQYDSKVQGQLDLLKLEASSKTYKNVLLKRIDNFSTFGGVDKAKELFDSVKSQMTANDKADIEEKLKKGIEDHASLITSDKIFNQFKEDPNSAYEEASKIKDPKLKVEVIKALDSNYSLKQRFDDRLELQKQNKIYNLIQDNPDLPYNDFKEAIKAANFRDPKDAEYANKIFFNNKSGKGTVDLAYYYKLRRMPEEELKQIDLSSLEVRERLGEKKWLEIEKLQREGETLLTNPLSKTIIEDTFTKAGVTKPTGTIEDSEEEWKNYHKLNDSIMNEINRTRDGSPENVKKITNDILIKYLDAEKSKPGFLRKLFTGAQPEQGLIEPSKKLFMSPIEPSKRLFLEKLLKDKKEKATEENIQSLFNEIKSNKGNQ